MHLAALTHLTIAAQTISACDRVIVLGSAALLASLPALADAHGPMELTRDADLLLLPSDEALAALIHEALGEGSLFDARFGYHVDVLRPEICQSLPVGWESRLLEVPGSPALALPARHQRHWRLPPDTPS